MQKLAAMERLMLASPICCDARSGFGCCLRCRTNALQGGCDEKNRVEKPVPFVG